MQQPSHRGYVTRSPQDQRGTAATAGLFDPAERQVLTVPELCNRWAVSQRTLERWRNEGRGPEYLKLYGRVCYKLDAIFAFERKIGRRATSMGVQ